jgi:outer membrane protein assembly factor BamB
MHSAAAVWVTLLGLFPAASVRAQPSEGSDPAPPSVAAEPVPSLRADATLVRKLEAARHALDRESWAEAAYTLQALLDGGEDTLVQVPCPGGEAKGGPLWTGIRTEAARLLGAMPSAGREVYLRRCGPHSRALLAEAREKRAPHLFAEIARRYPHTPAGAEALALLGLYHLDRGHDTLAACYFARRLDLPDIDRLPPATLFHAAAVLHRAGDESRAERAWREMVVKAPGGLRLGGRAVDLVDLRRELERSAAPGVAGPGTASLPGAKPWTRATAHEDSTRDWLQSAVRHQEARDRPVLPGSVPLLVGDRLVHRSYRGLHARDTRTGRQVWEAASPWSLDGLATQPSYGSPVESWVSAYLDVSPQALYGNAMLGTLSTDGNRVYAVDDLGVPPYRDYARTRMRWRQEPPLPDWGPELTEAAGCNRLLALDAGSGKPAWSLGGPGTASGPFADTYFLGPPLPLDDRLYVLTEKDHELALLCLDVFGGTLLGRQALAYAPTRLLLDPGRRLLAGRPVYADGVLICPTTAGVVVGVDVVTHGLAWAYPYRSGPLTQAELSADRRRRLVRVRLTAEWQVPVAVVGHGRVLLAAADDASFHCLSLRGTPLWQSARADDDLYVAGVFGGKVLVVGKRTCRALDLAGGKQLWELKTGLPSGVGAAAGNIYYLPLKEPEEEKGPAVYAIDVARGVIVARTPTGTEAPGNLLLGCGEVFSQTATAVTAYPVRDGGGK